MDRFYSIIVGLILFLLILAIGTYHPMHPAIWWICAFCSLVFNLSLIDEIILRSYRQEWEIWTW